ncbi:MAG: site-2 protease family protein [Panacagrimonas sp.]
MPDFSLLAQQIAVWVIPVLLAITVHEAAHGYAARELGDDTAARAGRLTLNPLRHIDPVGTLLIPGILLLISAPFLFGWAKPVPVNFGRLRSPMRDMALVAGAGPAVNLVMAVGWVALLWVYQAMGEPQGGWNLMRDMCVAGVSINVVLMVLNLLPVPPLDGGRIAVGLLPPSIGRLLAGLERWGLLILVALLATGLLSKLMFWPIVLTETLLYRSFGINLIEP